MSIKMASEEMRRFLKEPLLTFVATLTKTGHPHVTPRWSYYDGHHFYMTLVDGNPKTRALARDNRISLAIGSYDMPFRAVLVHGTAELLRDNVEPTIRQIMEKYAGPDKAEGMTDFAMTEPQVIAKVTPIRIYTWDQSKVPYSEVLASEKSGTAFRVL